LGVSGLVAAMKLILEIGIENIASELLRKRAWLVPALQGKGCQVLQPEAPPGSASAIISFSRSGRDLSELHQKMSAAKITASLRVDRAGQRYLRLSPHFYNTDAELQQVLDRL
jgi:cysteine desulfurase/selenocysteine lyase